MSIALDTPAATPAPPPPKIDPSPPPVPNGAAPATPTTPPAAPAAGGSASGAGQTPASPPAGEPSWRERLVTLAGGDRSLMPTLERYTDEAAWIKSNWALRQKLKAGEIKEPPAPFPDKGTDAEKTAWRAANGIPDKPEAYLEKIAPPQGVVFGDADKPGLERLAKFAAQNNWSAERYNETLAAYHHELEAITAAREQADDQYHQESMDALNMEWGQDYRRNVNAVKNLIAGAPEGLGERLLGGRTADGKLVGDDPAILKWLAQLELDRNPAATILPSGMSMTGAKSRLEELNAMSADAGGPYYNAHNAQELQREHFKLLQAEERSQPRGRAA